MKEYSPSGEKKEIWDEEFSRYQGLVKDKFLGNNIYNVK